MLARQQYFEHVSEKLELRRLRIAHLAADRFHFLTSDGHVVRGGVADSHKEMAVVKKHAELDDSDCDWVVSIRNVTRRRIARKCSQQKGCASPVCRKRLCLRCTGGNVERAREALHG